MRTTFAICLAFAIIGTSLPDARAQQRIVTIPADAKRAVIVFNGSPDVALDGRAARLSPGARIFDRNNYLQMFGSLAGSYVVKVQFEELTGLVRTVWILTDDEIVQSDRAAAR